MSLWEFNAAIGGFLKANSTEDAAPLSTSEAAGIAAALDAPPIWH